MRLKPRAGLIAVIAALFCAAGFWIGSGAVASFFWLLGGTLMAVVGAVFALIWAFRLRNRRAQDLVSQFVAQDAAPCFVTDDEGELWYVNDAAKDRFRGDALTLAGLLGDVFASPLAVLHRLRRKAEKTGAAREDIATRKGSVRLSTHRLGSGEYLWRVEEIGPRSSASSGDASFLPLLTVGRNDTVLFMNDAARRLVGERVKALDRLFVDLPPRPGEANALNTTSGTVQCILAERELPGGRREIVMVPTDTTEESEVALPVPSDGGWNDVEALPVPLLKVAPGGEVLLSNRLARDLLGRQDCTGVHLATMMEGLGRSLTDWLSEVSTGRETNSSEFLRVTREDREVFAQVMLKRASDPGDPALVAVLNDATELKTLEAQFVQSQKMQAIGQLAGGVAHDFNNLLTAIAGHCDLLLLRHDQGDPDYSDLVQINQNANRAAALVNQLLAFSRKQTLRLEELDLRDTLSDLTHLLGRLVGEKVTLTLTHDPTLHRLRADKRQLEQVVMNLVVNARDAMPNGGEIRIETRNLSYPKQVRRDRATVPAGDYVVVEIRDEGVGIPTDKLQKIFEPFYTTKRTGEGTGLGLSTAYGIVKQSGGFIFTESTPSVGTCFTLLFPANQTVRDEAHANPATHPAEFQPAATPPGLDRSGAASPAPHEGDGAGEGASDADGDGVILLVEDEAPVRAFASRALRLRGYTVLEAESAEDALEMLEETDLSVDIFVTDVIMPGMDGPSWVRQALETRPGVRVVFVSGYAEDAFGEGQMKIPNSVFLPKPFSLSELTDTIRRQLH
ncbi:ATP-binding protein [Alisedimentitalea sp. MJ-SS2]|uniref:ATP-binding protein n=1 Tax=Aliisedimentitalea sp. MJ-SS2 TaxID=3049795 RepID=UPI00290FA0E5|nr:ATP-binding protein [Alisedimentitalea sp. MJ-SS2]MDU8926787.1 ATP-binding protein [Alisedimentitalea sp. MJ-SS2]